MNTFINSLYKESTKKETENKSLSYSSSLSSIVDLFSLGGAYRKRSNEDIARLVLSAWGEDPELTLKCLFYLRDIRGGQGERRIFREGLKALIETVNLTSKEKEKIARIIPEYGRWDDAIVFWDDPKFASIIREQLVKDVNNKKPSLLAKWMPSINTSSNDTKKMARKIAKDIGISERNYRRLISQLRKKLNLVETKMSNREWGNIRYEAVPSQAMNKYRTAFYRHDENRMTKYIEGVLSGDKKINTSTLAPYQIFQETFRYMHSLDKKRLESLDALWNNLPDFVPKGQKAIVVADTSGSMVNPNHLPMSVSLSLALYFAERNKGPFENTFITFSERPDLQRVPENTNLIGKAKSMRKARWEFNTNINAVFDLILDTIQNSEVQPEDVPQTIYIVSDMEFDACVKDKTNFEIAKERFNEAGCKLPNVVFWNADARNDTIPVRYNENGVALVSGTSPSTFKMVVEGELTPEKFMLKVLKSSRYDLVTLELKSGFR